MSSLVLFVSFRPKAVIVLIDFAFSTGRLEVNLAAVATFGGASIEKNEKTCSKKKSSVRLVSLLD